MTFQVSCVNQQLTHIPEYLPTPSQLDLRGNHFDVITRNNLSSFEQLRSLSLTYSEISEIQRESFHGLVDLSSIDLTHNLLRVIQSHTFSGLPNLDRLDLAYNLITTIEDCAFSGVGSPSLGVTLKLQMNPHLREIHSLAFQDAPIEYLLIKNSSLTSLSLLAIKDLKNSLRFLFLTENSIPLVIPQDLFSGFNLMRLDLNSNGIRNVHFLRHLHTDVLSLSANPIGPTNFSHYESLRSLQELSLDQSGFNRFEYSFFSSLYNLEQLSLNNNNISHIHRNVKPLIQGLRGISLASNPLHCNCELSWLHSFVKRKRRGFSLQAECATPVHEDMFDMTASQFQCHAPADVRLRHVITDDVAMLECVTRDADPYPVITWTFPSGRSLVVPAAEQFKSVIHEYLPLHENSTSGFYGCQASNHLGHHSNQIYVDIYEILSGTSDKRVNNAGSAALFSRTPLLLSVLLLLLV